MGCRAREVAALQRRVKRKTDYVNSLHRKMIAARGGYENGNYIKPDWYRYYRLSVRNSVVCYDLRQLTVQLYTVKVDLTLERLNYSMDTSRVEQHLLQVLDQIEFGWGYTSKCVLHWIREWNGAALISAFCGIEKLESFLKQVEATYQ